MTPRCHTTYEEVQRKHMHRYAIFKIDQKKGEIDLEKIGERNSSYDDFLRDLQQMDGAHPDCRYGLYDYEYQYNPDGAQSTKRDKLFLIVRICTFDVLYFEIRSFNKECRTLKQKKSQF